MTFPKLACGLGWFVGGFLFALGFLFVGRGGVLNGHKVQNKDFRCESLILKFLGVAEPTSEQGVETPRNSDVSKSLTLCYTNQCVLDLLSFSLLKWERDLCAYSGITKLKPVNPWEVLRSHTNKNHINKHR